MIDLQASWWSAIIVTTLGIAPMVIAYLRRAEHIWWVISVNVFALVGPIGLPVWLAALALSILDRKEVPA